MSRAGIALALCADSCGHGFRAASRVPGDDGQTPPKESQPQPDPGTTGQSKCISEDENYKRNGNSVVYVIALENKCEARLKCEVYAYVVSAMGPSQGRTTMILAPSSQGAAAKKSYAMKVKMVGGSAQIARACRVL